MAHDMITGSKMILPDFSYRRLENTLTRSAAKEWKFGEAVILSSRTTYKAMYAAGLWEI